MIELITRLSQHFCLLQRNGGQLYVGNLTDSRRGQGLECPSLGAAMAHYDPETLILLPKVLDEAWAALPDGSKSDTVKSEMAQHILKQAADGVRDPIRLRASALASAVGERTMKQQRRLFKQQLSFRDRLASFAKAAREKASLLPPGAEKDELLHKAQQADTAAHLNEWANSPGLQPPK